MWSVPLRMPDFVFCQPARRPTRRNGVLDRGDQPQHRPWAQRREGSRTLMASCRRGGRDSPHRYVTPLSWTAMGDWVNLQECLDWVNARSGWKLGVQAHRYWGIA